MKNEQLKYIYHLDNIRINKNMTVKQLCEGICSDRQYRKYLSGDNSISDQRISEFCDRLEISPRDFYYSLNEKDQSEYKKVIQIYHHLTRKQYEDVTRLIKAFPQSIYLNNQNQRLFDYCLIRYRYETRKDRKQVALKKAAEVVNYPECESYNVFDFVDILFLQLISQIEVEQEIDRSLNILIRVLSNPQVLYLSGNERDIIGPIYSNVTIILGRLNRLEQCIEVAGKGIDYCIKNAYNKSLTRLYYAKALAHHALSQIEESHHYATLCLANAMARNNQNEFITFNNLINKFLERDPIQMFESYVQKLYSDGHK